MINSKHKRITDLGYGNSIWIDDTPNPHVWSDWQSDDKLNVLNKRLEAMYGKKEIVQRLQDSNRLWGNAIRIK